MTVMQMSERELTRLRVLIDLSDRRLTVEAAGGLMGVGRRQVYRLRHAFAADGTVALVSRKRGRPRNHRRGETFRRTVLTLVREHYPDFGPTLAVEKLAARHGLRVGVETLRQWMMSDGLWKDRRHRLPSPHQPRRRRDCVGELVQIGVLVPNVQKVTLRKSCLFKGLSHGAVTGAEPRGSAAFFVCPGSG